MSTEFFQCSAALLEKSLSDSREIRNSTNSNDSISGCFLPRNKSQHCTANSENSSAVKILLRSSFNRTNSFIKVCKSNKNISTA